MVLNCHGGSNSEIENEYRKAIALNPKLRSRSPLLYVAALGWRNEEGLEQVKEALRLDPVSFNINSESSSQFEGSNFVTNFITTAPKSAYLLPKKLPGNR